MPDCKAGLPDITLEGIGLHVKDIKLVNAVGIWQIRLTLCTIQPVPHYGMHSDVTA